VLSGRVANPEPRPAGVPPQLVQIEVKACGPLGQRWLPVGGLTGLAEGTAPVSGDGTWRWRYFDARFDEAAYFRASVEGARSRAVVVRTALRERRAVGGRVLRIVVDTADTRQSLRGRVVELQRLAGGRWLRVRAGRFRRAREHRFEASFRVVERGLTLRAHVPARSAAPCYLPGATSPWTS